MRVLATVANMEKHAGPDAVQVCEVCGETYSATPGDYFYQPRNVPVGKCCGRLTVLATRIRERAKPIEVEDQP